MSDGGFLYVIPNASGFKDLDACLKSDSFESVSFTTFSSGQPSLDNIKLSITLTLCFSNTERICSICLNSLRRIIAFPASDSFAGRVSTGFAWKAKQSTAFIGQPILLAAREKVDGTG